MNTEKKQTQLDKESPGYMAPDFKALGLIDVPDCPFVKVEEDGILPPDFSVTTNHPTYVKVDGEWVMVKKDLRMDAHVVRDSNTGETAARIMRNVHIGDLVAVAKREDGKDGFFTWDQGFVVGTSSSDAFSFMVSSVSREKPSDYTSIVDLLMANRAESGYVIWVLGPAIVHSGARSAIEWLIHQRFIHSMFAGNAVPAHDIENALFGTTLGMLPDGTSAPGGHKNHLKAINEVRKAGSIKSLVDKGQLTNGIMHALTVTNTPYVLAGSIRDDGPIPEVITDAVKAQEAMMEEVTKATMAVMVATTLHSIATGNMLSTYTIRENGDIESLATVCVDQTEFVVSKLQDRGTHQAIGVVTNAQDFVAILHTRLRERLQEESIVQKA